MHVFVLYGSNRLSVQIRPGALLSEIKNEACEKLKLDGELYTLRLANSKTPLDLSLAVRFANLATGSKLELCRATGTRSSGSSAQISIALQVGPARSVLKFSPQTSIWAVLQGFEQATGTNITHRQDEGIYYLPAVQIINREINNLNHMSQSLSSLGLTSGSVMFRISYKSSGKSLEQVSSEYPRLFNHTDQEPTQKVAEEPPQKADAVAVPANEEEQEDQKQQPTVVESKGKETVSNDKDISVGQRVATVYIPSITSQSFQMMQNENDSVYDMSTNQARVYQAHLSRMAHPQRQMLTKNLRQKMEEEELAKTMPKVTEIRIRFPDQTQIQAEFNSKETVDELYSFVKSALRDPDMDFYLYTIPPKVVLDHRENQLYKQGLGSRAVIHFGLVNNGNDNGGQGVSNGPDNYHYLKRQYLQKARELSDAAPSTSNTPQSASTGPSANGNNSTVAGGSANKDKVPKWLKLGKNRW